MISPEGEAVGVRLAVKEIQIVLVDEKLCIVDGVRATNVAVLKGGRDRSDVESPDEDALRINAQDRGRGHACSRIVEVRERVV